MVAVAHRVEHRIVAPEVAGSRPVGHPNHTHFIGQTPAARERLAADIEAVFADHPLAPVLLSIPGNRGTDRLQDPDRDR